MLPSVRNGSSRAATVPANRLFNTFFGDDFFAPLAAARSAMPLSTWEDENNIYVEIDAPGVAEQDVDVSICGDELIVRMERKHEQKSGGYDTRSYGKFEQRLTLSTAVDHDNVEANLAGGVLSLRFAKSDQAKPRRIAVKTE